MKLLRQLNEEQEGHDIEQEIEDKVESVLPRKRFWASVYRTELELTIRETDDSYVTMGELHGIIEKVNQALAEYNPTFLGIGGGVKFDVILKWHLGIDKQLRREKVARRRSEVKESYGLFSIGYPMSYGHATSLSAQQKQDLRNSIRYKKWWTLPTRDLLDNILRFKQQGNSKMYDKLRSALKHRMRKEKGSSSTKARREAQKYLRQEPKRSTTMDWDLDVDDGGTIDSTVR